MTRLLHQSVSEQAEKRGEAVAVAMNEQRLTYGELEQSSTRLGRLLRDAGCKKGDRVCFLLPKSPVAVETILGILKADCVYVPLDPSSPAPRLAGMIASCEPRCLLATGPTAPLLEDVCGILDHATGALPSIGWMDPTGGRAKSPVRATFSVSDLAGYSTEPLHYRSTAGDPAYILFTSGSTGIPKGVVITHSNVFHFVQWATRHFGIGPSDRLSGHSPFHFDLSVFDLFGTFASGAQLHLVPPELNLLPSKLMDFMRRAELTQWFSVPSLLAYVSKFDVLDFNDLPTLKRLLWCGEVFPTPALIYWMKRLPHVTFTNLYGPTEATVASSFYTVPECPHEPTREIPIGTPCDGEGLLVLNEALQPVANGEEGDLYIRGVGLSPGYWRDPDKTRSVFLSDPARGDPSDRIYKTGDRARIGEAGLVYFRGRTDFQIKSRGHRIELGEIEVALATVEGVRESAVVAISTEGFEGAVICCAYVPASSAQVTPSSLRKDLGKALPQYMLPSRWTAMDALPRNTSGKIDRRRLMEGFRLEPDQAH
jgi:amino acid adenylation domain-containing protein